MDITNWKILGLDEWVGLNGNDEGSCRFHLNNQLFHPLKINNVKQWNILYKRRAASMFQSLGSA
ncbi:MAG: hypothetical protein IPP72_05625 [Chitinophagaceae bacterium]|nr:hypothetical protein [Chitinophagaceae bacterium]